MQRAGGGRVEARIANYRHPKPRFCAQPGFGPRLLNQVAAALVSATLVNRARRCTARSQPFCGPRPCDYSGRFLPNEPTATFRMRLVYSYFRIFSVFRHCQTNPFCLCPEAPPGHAGSKPVKASQARVVLSPPRMAVFCPPRALGWQWRPDGRGISQARAMQCF